MLVKEWRDQFLPSLKVQVCEISHQYSVYKIIVLQLQSNQGRLASEPAGRIVPEEEESDSESSSSDSSDHGSSHSSDIQPPEFLL